MKFLASNNELCVDGLCSICRLDVSVPQDRHQYKENTLDNREKTSCSEVMFHILRAEILCCLFAVFEGLSHVSITLKES